MEVFPDLIIIVLVLIILFYFLKIEMDNNKWKIDKYNALYHYSNKFFKKQGYEICKIDVVDKSDYKGKTFVRKPFLQEEQFIRKVLVMDSERNKYQAIVKVNRSSLFGTSIKILRKEKYTE